MYGFGFGEVAPDGVHVTIAYEGQITSIPAAIERLRAAGVLDLVKPTATHTAPLNDNPTIKLAVTANAANPVRNTG